jgi:hypothetical protein
MSLKFLYFIKLEKIIFNLQINLEVFKLKIFRIFRSFLIKVVNIKIRKRYRKLLFRRATEY